VDRVEDIHPIQKKEVGERLALWALANTYGKAVVCSGPLYKSVEFASGKAVLHFDSIGAGLASRDGKPLDNFTIAGADGIFVPAEATIQGDASSSRLRPSPTPVRALRLERDRHAQPRQQGRLPASPFRTDDFKLAPPKARSTSRRPRGDPS